MHWIFKYLVLWYFYEWIVTKISIICSTSTLFYVMFSCDIVYDIIHITNFNISKLTKNTMTELNVEQCFCFIGLTYLMTRIPQENKNNYWKKGFVEGVTYPDFKKHINVNVWLWYF